VVLVGLLSAVAVGALGLFVLRPWWQELAPDGAQLPVGLVSLALGGGLFLWLRQAPKRVGVHRRRRGRLRDRLPRNRPPSRGNGA
jgi:hypothetical protein